jgi:hypothetical protein
VIRRPSRLIFVGPDGTEAKAAAGEPMTLGNMD